MDAKKEKPAILITPIGTLKFPYLTHPDTAFDEKGVYRCDLVVNPEREEVKEFLKNIQTALKAKFKKGGHLPFEKDTDEGGEETGMYAVKFKSKYAPRLFDGEKNPVPSEIKVGSGSEARVAYSINFYEGFGGGINLYLQAVQIITLVEYMGKSASSFGFTDIDPIDNAEPGADGTATPGEKHETAEEDNLPF